MARKIVFWTHLVVGVVAGVAILVMSATGVALAFERQILQLVDRDLRTVAVPSDGRPRPLADILASVGASRGSLPTGIVVRPGSSSTVELTLGREGSVFVDPYTGAVLGQSSRKAREVFGVVERFHRTLGEPLRSRGPLRAFGAASNLVFLALALSGPYLWLPRRWSWAAVRSGSVFRLGLRGRARDWNWHNSVGLWCALPLVLITATGAVISYPWANALLFRLAGSPVPSRPVGPPGARPEGGARADGAGRAPFVAPTFVADFDRAAAVAGASRTDWRTMTLRVPAPTDTTVSVSLDAGTGGQVEKRTEVVVDTRSGQIVKTTRFADGSPGQRLRALARFTHTGEAGGLVGQAIAALASAGAVLLVWTGLSLAWRRFRAWRGRRPLEEAGAS
jgi:uncharacterized iron-regulated membrane protein